MTSRILIVDGQPIARQGLLLLIEGEADLEVCGEAESASDALDAVSRLAPDLVISDLTLTEGGGLDLARELKSRNPELPVLIFSMHDEALYAERALTTGARGYVMKSQPLPKVLEAIGKVLAGQVALSEEMSARILDRFISGTPTPGKSPVDRLTDRELEVFQLIGRGLGTREISERLHLSVKTIEGYNEKIKSKLRLRSANELIRRAVLWVESESGG